CNRAWTRSSTRACAGGRTMYIRDAYAHYETRNGLPIRAVDGVSLEIADGEILGIVGEAGCGKSTLAAVLSSNAAPNLTVTSGELAFDTEPPIDLARDGGIPRAWRGARISLLPQRALNALNPTARIEDYAFDVMRAHQGTLRRKEALALAE